MRRIEATERRQAEAVIAHYAKWPLVQALELTRAQAVVRRYEELDRRAAAPFCPRCKIIIDPNGTHYCGDCGRKV